MAEERKSRRWIRSLGEAGFLDEVDAGWSMPARDPVPEAAIVVDQGSDPPPAAPAVSDPAPGPLLHRGVLPSMPDVEGGELPQTPVERVRPAGRATPPVPRPLPGDSWAEVVEDESRTPVEPLAPDGNPSRRERLSVPSGGHRITVPPAPVEQDFGGVGTIEEELPDRDGARQRMRETVRPGRRTPAAGSGEEEERAPRSGMTELADLGDFSGALAAAEEILRGDPGNGEAQRVREQSRRVLLQMYESRLGPLDRIPRLAVAENQLVWRNLDPVSGFVLSRVDGFSTFEDIIDISSLPRFETCRILDRLLQDGLLRVDR
jgi:hypothetical protein